MTLETTATLALIASHAIVIGLGFYVGRRHGKEVGYLEAEYEIAAIASEPQHAELLAKWESEVGKVMPSDFKLWHENSPHERPLITRLVIEALKQSEQLLWDAALKRDEGHDCRFFKAANGECMACSVLENRKQSSPFTVAEEGEWIPWDGGGECPVSPGTLVDVKYRNGDVKTRLKAYIKMPGYEWDAGPCFWMDENRPGDIKFYRLSK